MSPVLLDERKIIQIIFLAIIIIMLSFSGGYYLAYQPVVSNASPVTLADQEKQPEAMPEKKSARPPLAEKKAINKAIKKDNKKEIKKKATSKPAAKAKQEKTKSEKKKVIKKKTHEKKTIKKPAAKKVNSSKKSNNNKEVTRDAGQSKAEKSLKKPVQLKPGFLITEPVATTELTPEIASTGLHYSIQVGAFASQDNAQKLVDEIKNKKFEAYISEYVSQKGVVKYNVRFGDFTVKSQAEIQLAQFKKLFVMPAYIINQ